MTWKVRERSVRGASRKESEEKACLFANDKPAHRTVFSTFCRSQLPSAFSPRRSKTFGITSPLSCYSNTLRFSMWQLPAPDSTDQSRPIPRDFNMNCLLIAMRPPGTLHRYFSLSVRRFSDTCTTSRRPFLGPLSGTTVETIAKLLIIE